MREDSCHLTLLPDYERSMLPTLGFIGDSYKQDTRYTGENSYDLSSPSQIDIYIKTFSDEKIGSVIVGEELREPLYAEFSPPFHDTNQLQIEFRGIDGTPFYIEGSFVLRLNLKELPVEKLVKPPAKQKESRGVTLR